MERIDTPNTTELTEPATTVDDTLEKFVETEDRRLEQNEQLITVLQEVETEIKKQNSLKYVFVRGALYGLGTVIGATVLITILGWFLARTVGSLENFPIIGHLISEEIVETIERIR